MTLGNGDVGSVDFPWRDLLRRYMLHVAECEGITFVDRLNNADFTNVRFTQEEIILLSEIEKHLEAP